MAKAKTIYVCQSCGVTSPKWVGKCTSCGEWNSVIEEIEVVDKKSRSNSVPNVLTKPLKLSEISTGKMIRFSTSNS